MLQLYWLPAGRRIQLKLCTIMHSVYHAVDDTEQKYGIYNFNFFS